MKNIYTKNPVKEWRTKFGFTQEKASSILEVGRATLARWERTPPCTPYVVVRLLDYFNKEEHGGDLYWDAREKAKIGHKAWLTAHGFLQPSQTENSQEKPQPPPESSPDE